MGNTVPDKRKRLVPKEAEVARLWHSQAVRSRSLRTTDGERLQVLYPGRPSSEAGPDFKDALVVTQRGGFLQGDVEVHVDQRGWRSHGHHRDPRYNGVILHAVLYPQEGVTPLEAGGTAPVVALGPLKSRGSPRAKAQAASSRDQREAPLLAWRQGLPEEEVGRLLDRAGDQRFFAKSECFGQEMAQGGEDQVLYEALLEALGYSQNQEPFRALASLLPWQALRREALTVSQGDRGGLLEALLLGRAGLLPSDVPNRSGGLTGDLQEHVRRLADRWPEALQQPASLPWNLFRVRPENHPLRRLLGAASLLLPHVEQGLATGMEALLKEEKGCARLTTRLRASAPGIGAGGPRQGQRAPAFIGEGRARDLLVNVLLPFFHAKGGITGAAWMDARALELYHQMPLLQENAITREMRRQLLPPDSPLVQGARRQQGLIHLYRTVFGRVHPAPTRACPGPTTTVRDSGQTLRLRPR